MLIDWDMIHTVPSCIAGDVDPHGGAGCRGLGVSQPAVTEAGEECVRAAAEGVRAARLAHRVEPSKLGDIFVSKCSTTMPR